MQLPVMPPVKPMLAKAAAAIPDGLCYEPKWDGFRCIVFRDGDEVELGSRNERPLTRYFPEVVAAVRAQLPTRCVVDGELVLAQGGRLAFEALLQRIHPAASRVRLLAEQTPAAFVAFDLLALDELSLLAVPFRDRRDALVGVLADASPAQPGAVPTGVHLTPLTEDADRAREWFTRFEGAGLDGVVGKAADLRYQPDKRVMTKVKHARTADCVLAGFRWHASGPVVGSLLLGLYDDAGALHHVGVAASFTAARRAELVTELQPWRLPAAGGHPWADGADGAAPGGGPDGAAGDGGSPATGGAQPGGEPSRWNRGKDLSFVPLRPERVVEVGYDYLEGARFRHTTQFRRWRPDRSPTSCTFEQLERPVDVDVAGVLTAPG